MRTLANISKSRRQLFQCNSRCGLTALYTDRAPRLVDNDPSEGPDPTVTPSLICVCFRLFQLTHVGQVLLSLLTREWSDRSQGRWRPLPPVLTLSTECWPCATPPTILSTPTLTSSPASAHPPESPQPLHPLLLLHLWTEPAQVQLAPPQVSVLTQCQRHHFTFYICCVTNTSQALHSLY